MVRQKKIGFVLILTAVLVLGLVALSWAQASAPQGKEAPLSKPYPIG